MVRVLTNEGIDYDAYARVISCLLDRGLLNIHFHEGFETPTGSCSIANGT
jgi:hypothetical protein